MNALQTLVNGFNTMLGWLKGVWDSLVSFFRLIGQAIGMVDGLLTFLPSVIYGIVTLSFTIILIKLVVGRH